MDEARARALLAGERARLQRLLQAEAGKPEAAELGDEVDDADRRDAEETGMAVDQLLRARWAALQRAEATQQVDPADKARFHIGAHGNPVYREVFSRPATSAGGCMLAARLTARGARGGRRRGRIGVGRPSLRGARRCRHHPRGGAGQRGGR